MEKKQLVPDIKNCAKHFEKDRSKMEHYFRKILEIRQSLESQFNAASTELSQLRDEERRLESENAVLKFKCDKMEQEICEMEEANSATRETTAQLQISIKGHEEKRSQDMEAFEKEAALLCENFVSATCLYDEETLEAETETIYKRIKDIEREIEDVEAELSRCKNELDDIVIYQAPHSPAEAEIPLGQRKMVLNLFESANMRAKVRLENAYKIKAAKETEMEAWTGIGE